MDLGVSSVQFDEGVRGFSFQHDAPLDMRMDSDQSHSAYTVVNHAPEKELAKIITDFGEEKPKTASKIAHAIKVNRPIKTTFQLAEVIQKVSPRQGKIHPATRTFQAIRIVVNDELEQLKQTLPIAIDLLNPGGRIAVISFHSLEDRIVKEIFYEEAKAGYEAKLELLNKKPVEASRNEIVYNPRSRSAKLRGAVKI
jgi:16S rRNA (cytosine1402-N4)-methyltransferase